MHTRDRVSSMNYILMALVSSCMLVNSLFPSLCLKHQDYDLVVTAIQSQKVVFQVFLLTEIPLQIMAALMAGESRNACPSNKNIPDTDRQDNSTIGEFRIVKVEKRADSHRCGKFGLFAQTCSMPGSVLFQYPATMMGALPAGGICLLLCISIFMLPRSSVGDDGLSLRLKKKIEFLPDL